MLFLCFSFLLSSTLSQPGATPGTFINVVFDKVFPSGNGRNNCNRKKKISCQINRLEVIVFMKLSYYVFMLYNNSVMTPWHISVMVVTKPEVWLMITNKLTVD